jgi:type II restriction enzyme
LAFIGRVSTSSSKFQDDLFSKAAIPPDILSVLGEENRRKNGIVEAYIYRRFAEKTMQFNSALQYATDCGREDFLLEDFLDIFWHIPGLRRSIDKIYEIVVYSLFDVLVEALNIQIEVSYDPRKMDILREFVVFAEKVLQLTPELKTLKVPAKVHRVGVTNAADRGLDMYSNFGIAIQIKHLSLTPELAEDIVGTITADRIVIVCKDAEEKIITSLLTQIGWKARIQSVIVESELIDWYAKAQAGKYGNEMGDKLLVNIRRGLIEEFPSSKGEEFINFMKDRKYSDLEDELWTTGHQDQEEFQTSLF